MLSRVLLMKFGFIWKCAVLNWDSCLRFVDSASLYNLVNKNKLVHNLFLVYLYLSISTCFGLLWAHYQEKQPCLCDTWYLSFCVDDCLVCRVEACCFSSLQGLKKLADFHITFKNIFYPKKQSDPDAFQCCNVSSNSLADTNTCEVQGTLASPNLGEWNDVSYV